MLHEGENCFFYLRQQFFFIVLNSFFHYLLTIRRPSLTNYRYYPYYITMCLLQARPLAVRNAALVVSRCQHCTSRRLLCAVHEASEGCSGFRLLVCYRRRRPLCLSPYTHRGGKMGQCSLFFYSNIIAYHVNK